MRRPVLLAAFTAFAVRVLIVTRLPAPPSWDGTIYAHLAQSLARGEGFLVWDGSARPTAFYPVGYPAVIALALQLLPSVQLAAHAVNVAAGTVSAACAAVLGYRVADTRGAYLAGLGYALAPGPALWTSATMTETLTGALLVAAVTAVTTPASTRRAHAGWSALAGVLVGLASLARPQVLLAAPFLGAIPTGTRGTRLAAGAVCVLAALAVVLPWTARNCTTMGGCALVSTNGGSNLLIGTLPEAGGGYVALRPSHGCAEVRGEVARDHCMTRLALVRVVRHPLTWARLGAVKFFKTFAFEWAPVSHLRTALPGTFPGASAMRAAAICTVWWWALLGAAMVGGRRAFRAAGHARTLARIVVLTVVLFALTHAVFIGDDRYHLPLVALLSSLAAGVFLPSRPRVDPELAWVS